MTPPSPRSRKLPAQAAPGLVPREWLLPALVVVTALHAMPALASPPRSALELWPAVGRLQVQAGCHHDAPIADAAACQGGERSGAAVELGVVLREELGRRVDGIATSADWGDLSMVELAGAPGARPVVVSVLRAGAAEPFGYFVLVPWQDLHEPRPDPLTPRLPPPLLVVTEQALVFGPLAGPDRLAPAALRQQVSRAARQALAVDDNNALRTDRPAVSVPAHVQLISVQSRRHQLTLQVALPGSRVDPAELAGLAPDRMIELLLVPDQGSVRRSWIAPATAATAPAVAEVSRRAPTSSAAVDDTTPDTPGLADVAYQPKRSPDTVLDYRPALAAAVDKLPPPELAALPSLLAMLARVRQAAQLQPGQWVEGNVILGADAREYQPSDPELLESELGERIRVAVAGREPADLERALASVRHRANRVEYRRIAFRHVDVMGSGRFFYASPPVPRSVLLSP